MHFIGITLTFAVVNEWIIMEENKNVMEASSCEELGDYYWGSICLDDIPPEMIKNVTFRNGKVKRYVNIKIKKWGVPVEHAGTVFTHYITCEPRSDLRVRGKNYKLGNLSGGSAGAAVPKKSAVPSGNGGVPPKDGLSGLPF